MCVILLQEPASLELEEGELPGNFQVTSTEDKGHKQEESLVPVSSVMFVEINLKTSGNT